MKDNSVLSKNIGIWIRVSTDDQARGESPEHHEERARSYAKSRGWEVKEVYDLAGQTGKAVMQHPEAIETKTRSKRVATNGAAEHEAVFDGQTIRFPWGDATLILQVSAKREISSQRDLIRGKRRDFLASASGNTSTSGW